MLEFLIIVYVCCGIATALWNLYDIAGMCRYVFNDDKIVFGSFSLLHPKEKKNTIEAIRSDLNKLTHARPLFMFAAAFVLAIGSVFSVLFCLIAWPLELRTAWKSHKEHAN